MFNVIELLDDGEKAPCRFGNIVPGHACYCHNDQWADGPRKCPIWRNFGVSKERWFGKEGAFDDLPYEGGCPRFESSDRVSGEP